MLLDLTEWVHESVEMCDLFKSLHSLGVSAR